MLTCAIVPGALAPLRSQECFVGFVSHCGRQKLLAHLFR